MKNEIVETIGKIKNSISLLEKYLNLESKSTKLMELEKLAENPKLWDDRQNAEAILKEKTFIENSIDSFNSLTQELSDNVELLEMGEAENDDEIINEAENALMSLAKRASQMETEGLFSGDADKNSCFMEIHSGAGGTESCDWAEMLLRMYIRWAELHDFKTEIIDETAGEEAGIKGVTIKISGQYAYGWSKVESGVHRLVRISPFDSANRRHTSFASVWVYPVIDDEIEVEIDDKDLRIDTYRASGAGGQHVNKTDSAVRITHIPTNVVVQCQNGRSQHRNKDEAMKMLKARLYELEMRKRDEEAEEANAKKTDNSWGNQIRSYVLHPYQMVKDLRTGFETGNTTAVLDGNLDDFMSSCLAERV